jgi:uncharacterized integral membrane protein
MPWRLIGFIILFGIFLVFIACNLGNKCDISFGFRTFKDVPVFLTAFSSFVLGMFCAMPFIISFRIKRKKDKAEAPSKPKKKWGKKGGETNTGAGPQSSANSRADSALEDNSFTNGGPYGIN